MRVVTIASTTSIDDINGLNPPLPSPSSSIPSQAVQSNHEIVEETSQSLGVASQSTSIKQEDTNILVEISASSSYTSKRLETYVASLDEKALLPASKMKTKCTEVLNKIQTHEDGWVFNSPVDPVELGLPDYFDIIKMPMDLGTVQKRLENGFYHSIDEFAMDVNLTFDNATTYNAKGTPVYNMAVELKTKFGLDLRKLYDGQKTSIMNKVRRFMLLRHGAKCKRTSNCPITRHCASMKSLWKHIKRCHDESCQVKHCLSSQYVLRHYRDCNVPQCLICTGVRKCSVSKGLDRNFYGQF